MADLTHQNQELTREVNKHKQRRQHHTEGLGQNLEVGEVENNAKGRNKSRHCHMQGATFGEGDGSDEEGYGRDEGLYEKDEPCG